MSAPLTSIHNAVLTDHNGGWCCPSIPQGQTQPCYEHNIRCRSWCHRCNAKRPAHQLLDADWTCFACSDRLDGTDTTINDHYNYASNLLCHTCFRPRPIFTITRTLTTILNKGLYASFELRLATAALLHQMAEYYDNAPHERALITQLTRALTLPRCIFNPDPSQPQFDTPATVSYTHLTLPTSPKV